MLTIPAYDVFLLLISVRNWVDRRATVRPEGLSQWKIPVTSSVIEPVTFGLVAQWLNQLRHSTVLNITPVCVQRVLYSLLYTAIWNAWGNSYTHSACEETQINPVFLCTVYGAYRGSWGVTPLIRHINTRWKLMENFTTPPLYLGPRTPQ